MIFKHDLYDIAKENFHHAHDLLNELELMTLYMIQFPPE